jgi:ankyrin repeat protein
LDRNVSGTGKANSYDLFINIETLDQQGFNFLHLVVLGLRQLNLEMVLAQCLSPQVDVDMPDINGRTPLIWAAWRGDEKSVDLLISSRAGVDRTDHEGYSAIGRAAKSGHVNCVRRLLEAGALISISDDYGLQPIHHASSNKANGFVVVDELLAWGADPNAQSACGTPLHFASNRGSVDTVKRLLSGGADIDAQDPDGDSPAMVALFCWNQSIFSYLMQAGAKLNHVRKTGENILHLVTWVGSTEIWSELSAYVNSEQTSGLDVKVSHNGHGLMHCFDHCRNLWYVGERETIGDELVKFRHMIDTFEDTLRFCV